MTESSLWFKASDEKPLAYLKVMPDGPAKAVVLIGHGMNDHKERFLALGQTLASAGAAVYIPDLRGHGDTDQGENRGYLADSNGFDRVVEDLIELGDFASKEQGHLPIFYFGHSFGGLVGMALASAYGKYLEGIVLSAPPERPDFITSFFGNIIVWIGKHTKGAHAPAILPNTMTFGGYAKKMPEARTKFDWLTSDKAVVDAYIADPKCNFVCSYGFYQDLMRGLKKVYTDGFLESIPTNLPIYLFCGSNDPVIGMKPGFEKLARQFRDLGLIDFETKCYEGGRHESINEINRDDVLNDISDWFSRHIA
ncbi:MAG: alpha/beta hydrolase [Spirochaetaceae bacterium]|nr:alpha/beta hydrolase [Spirochaetaceae bacterium]